MRYAGVGLAAAIILAIVLAWNHNTAKTAAALALADARRDSIATATAALERLEAQHDADQARWAADTLRLTAQLRASRRVMTLSRHHADSLQAIIDADTLAGPVEENTVLRQLAAQRLSEARSCQGALSVADSLFRGCTGLLERSRAIITEERAIRVELEGLVEVYRRQANPSFLTKLLRGVPYAAAGVLLGVALTQF